MLFKKSPQRRYFSHFIQYCYNANKKTILNTQIEIPPKYWQRKLCPISEDLPSIFGKAQVLNKELQRLQRLSEDIITYAIENNIPEPVKFVRETFHPSFNIAELNKARNELQLIKDKNEVNLDFFSQINEYINVKAKSVTPKMINVYKNMRDTLKAFETAGRKAITFDSIDYNFYEEFMNYMQNEHIQVRRKRFGKRIKNKYLWKND